MLPYWPRQLRVQLDNIDAMGMRSVLHFATFDLSVRCDVTDFSEFRRLVSVVLSFVRRNSYTGVSCPLVPEHRYAS